MEKRKGQIPLVCYSHSRPILDLSYSPIISDGFFLVSACKDGKPMLRNGETGDWIGTFDGHKGAAWAAVPQYSGHAPCHCICLLQCESVGCFDWGRTSFLFP